MRIRDATRRDATRHDTTRHDATRREAGLLLVGPGVLYRFGEENAR